ncbi:MAG TPA: hypothetical protein VE820_10380 [Sphingomicrobium sp.]|nr:hypothetical protein [Sphingomicrobium sp.]
MFGKLVHVVRLLFGLNFLLNGINWWWKILPYPTIGDPPAGPAFVQAMIDTGFLFGAIKIVEVVTGVAVLANRFVPLALAVAFPVTVAAWAVDVGVLGHSLRAQVMGWAVLSMNGFLMLAYFEAYRSMIALRARPYCSWSAKA